MNPRQHAEGREDQFDIHKFINALDDNNKILLQQFAQQFINNPDLLNKRIDKVLPFRVNGMSQVKLGDNPPPLFYLAFFPSGRELIKDNPKLLAAINAEGLNFTCINKLTPLHYLLRDEGILELFLRDSSFHTKIEAATFNSQDLHDMTPAAEMLESMLGITLLRGKELQSKVDHKTLNAKGFNLAQLTSHHLGRLLLAEASKWRETIDAHKLNHADKRHHSAAHHLLVTADGCRLLEHDADFREKISSRELCARDKKGRSPLYYLTKSTAGLKLLLHAPDLREKISSKALNTICSDGTSPAYFLCASPIGRQILLKDPSLSDKINAYSFNAIVRSGLQPGISAVFELLVSKVGRELLSIDGHLHSLIHSHVLGYEVEAGKHIEKRVADLLVQPECKQILSQLSPELREAVNDVVNPPLKPVQEQNTHKIRHHHFHLFHHHREHDEGKVKKHHFSLFQETNKRHCRHTHGKHGDYHRQMPHRQISTR